MQKRWSSLLAALVVLSAAPAHAVCVSCNLFLEEDESYWMWLVDNGYSAVFEEAPVAVAPRAVRWFGNGSLGIPVGQERVDEQRAVARRIEAARRFLSSSSVGLAYASLPRAPLPWAGAGGAARPAAPEARVSPGLVPLLLRLDGKRGAREPVGEEIAGDVVIPNLPELEAYGGRSGGGEGGQNQTRTPASNPIPEPTAALAYLTGLGLLGATRRRRT